MNPEGTRARVRGAFAPTLLTHSLSMNGEEGGSKGMYEIYRTYYLHTTHITYLATFVHSASVREAMYLLLDSEKLQQGISIQTHSVC